MKTIKIKFVDFYQNFRREDHILTKLLSQHYNLEWSEEPDYLIYGVFGDDHILYPNCVKICYTGENLCPDFNLCDYAVGFEYLEYGDRYFRLPVMYELQYEQNFHRMESRQGFGAEHIEERKFCNFIYSNGEADSIREDFFNYVNEHYKKVDSGGRYLNNIGKPCEDKYEFQKQYKFSITFENTAHSGYVTEKIVDAYGAGTIPVYWGDPDIDKMFNEESMIRITCRDDFQKALKEMEYLDQNEEAYRQKLKIPILQSESFSYENKMNELDTFLSRIMEQPKESAYRRNRAFWGELYQQKQAAYVKALRFKKKYINPIKGVCNKITGKI